MNRSLDRAALRRTLCAFIDATICSDWAVQAPVRLPEKVMVISMSCPRRVDFICMRPS